MIFILNIWNLKFWNLSFKKVKILNQLKNVIFIIKFKTL